MKTIQLLCAVLSAITIFSCSAAKYAYTPTTANLLQVEGKGNLQAAVNYATATSGRIAEGKQSSNGIDIQTAYAVTNKIVVKLDAHYKGEGNQSSISQGGVADEVVRYKKKGMEFSAGFNNFSKDKTRTGFQAFAGLGVGDVAFTSTYDAGNKDDYSMDYIKVFVQPSYTIFVSKHYDISFAGKLNMLTFSNVKSTYSALDEEALALISTKPSYFVDFIMQHQFGAPKLKALQFQVQTGLTALTTNFSSPQNNFTRLKYDYNSLWFALGVIADLKKLR